MNTFRPSDEQRAVIEHPLEPLRVLAGAGTGKTSTIALRIAYLIEHHGIEPEQVLGITFTNKAADELAQRVAGVLDEGVDPGRQVEIHTYHGFAAALLREFGALVGIEHDAGIVTPTFTRQMLHDAMTSIDLPNLNQTWAGTIDLLRRLSSQMADHLATVDDVRHHSDGDVEVLAKRRDLLDAITVYQQEKDRLGVVDYGDLLAGACRLATDHPWLVARIRRRYRCLVLDEYQDTNPAQRVLLTTIFGDGFPVTAVGDPDQTIYEWRGASPTNMLRFPEHFPRADGATAATLGLSRNRRSDQRILALANHVRSQIDDRPRAPLRATDDAADGVVRCGWFVDAVTEAEWIADDILRARASGHAWRDIGILFRKNRDMPLVRDALAARDVPVEVANLGGLLAVPEVVELHAWLRLLHQPDDGPALARVLTGSKHRLGLGDLAAFARWVRQRRATPEPVDAAPVEPDLPSAGMLEAIEHLSEIPDLGEEAAASAAVFLDRYRPLISAAQSSSLVELCRMILDATDAWDDIEALGPAARLSARLNLYRFLDLAEAWSPLEGRPSLAAFLGYLSTMDEEPAEELDTARLAGADAVTLLTVHRAKGLEWPVVYVPGTRARTFPSTVVGSYDNPFTRPESLPYQLRIDRHDLPAITDSMPETQQKELLRAHHLRQEWRIAYVAATRAREALTFTGAYWYGQPEPNVRPGSKGVLYELVESDPATEVSVDTTEPGPRPETLRAPDSRTATPDPFFESGWDDALRMSMSDRDHARRLAEDSGIVDAFDAETDRLQGVLFSLPEPQTSPSETESVTSVTGLVTYASCPKRFYWTAIDPLPRRPSPAARRGVAVHRRIELHHRGVMPLTELEPDLYDTTPAESTDQTPIETSAAFDVFQSSRFAVTRPVLVEVPFRLRLAARTSVRGRVDAVYRHRGDDQDSEDEWEIVDFKSGRPSTDPAAEVQLQAYALALDGGGLTDSRPERLRVTFAYLGGELTERTAVADREWLDRARRNLDVLAAGIERSEFEPAPAPSCRRCDFLDFCEPGRSFLAVEVPE